MNYSKAFHTNFKNDYVLTGFRSLEKLFRREKQMTDTIYSNISYSCCDFEVIYKFIVSATDKKKQIFYLQ